MAIDRYGPDDLRRAIRNPALIGKELGRLRRAARREWFQRVHGPGVAVMERDWDNLVILDACRYDVFDRVSDIDGDLEPVISRGSHSEEFCTANFAGQRHYDTVYVTANGYGARIGEGVFHDLLFTGDRRSDDPADFDRFDDAHPTLESLLPATVYDAAAAAGEQYPNKRLIVHFMQPHQPYLGPRAGDLRDRLYDAGVLIKAKDPEAFADRDTDDDTALMTLAQAAQQGHITREEFLEVYVENLEVVLEHVTTLLGELNGKTVITADHGNFIGKHGIYGHPRDRYEMEVRKVPWLTIPAAERREIQPDPPAESRRIRDDDVQRQLRLLGYAEDVS